MQLQASALLDKLKHCQKAISFSELQLTTSQKVVLWSLGVVGTSAVVVGILSRYLARRRAKPILNPRIQRAINKRISRMRSPNGGMGSVASSGGRSSPLGFSERLSMASGSIGSGGGDAAPLSPQQLGVMGRPLKDIEIQDILGDGNLSDIEGLDNEDEISPFSLLDWLEGDSPESQNVVEELDAPNEAMCNSSTLNSTLVTTGTLSNDCFEQHNVDQTLTSNTSCRATSLARPSRGRKKKTSGLLRSKSTPTSQQLSASRNTTARHASTPRPDSTQKKTHKSRAKSTRTSKQAADAATSMLARTSTRRQIGQPWQQLPFQNKPHEYPPPPVKEVREPIDYYNEYMDDDFFERIAYCTNMYHLRKTGKELKTNRAEIMHLFGIHILMGCIPYPRWKMYWRKGISMDKITSVMTRDRFSTLRNALHVVDTDTPPPGNTNFLWKVQPMLDQIRKGCYKQERVPGFYSVDEQMIPFTGRCAIRQVVKNKPRPVGLKNFVLTTSTGLMLDFDIYKGAKTMFGPDMSLGLGPAVVLHLSRSVPPGSCIYHDRYFTTIPLVEELDNRNIHSTGTIMTNRIPERSTLKFKDDKTMQRGESQQMVRGSVAVVKWKDNKSVFLTSNCSGSDKTEVVKRWDKKARSYVDVTAPQIVMNYNRHMGGVDVLDQQMEYYRTFIKTKKWTLKVLIHFSDLATVNAWRAYKIDCDANKYPGCKILDLLDFRLELHEVLVKAPPKRRNEVLTHEASDDEMPVMPRKYQKPANPPVSLIYDGYDHLPEFDDIKSPRACQFHRCCSRTKTRCIKCNVYLCIARNQNCFKMYHTK